MSEPEYERAIPVCPVCGGMMRADILPRKRWDDPTRGPWKCDLHGEVKPEWVYEDDEPDDEEGGR